MGLIDSLWPRAIRDWDGNGLSWPSLSLPGRKSGGLIFWIPACAGMTVLVMQALLAGIPFAGMTVWLM
jgi:hypothetical protein